MSGKYQPRNGLTKARSEPRVDRATQIIKKHKNVGTMANLMKPCGSCYDIQAQTSTTKASGSKQRETSEYDKVLSPHQQRRSPSPPPPTQYIPSSSIRRDKTPPATQDPYHRPQRSPSASSHIPIHVLSSSRLSRQPQLPQSLSRSRSRSRSPSIRHDQTPKPLSRSPSPPIPVHRSPPPKHYEPSSGRDRTESTPPSNYTRKSREQQQMTTRETETRFDNAISQHHQGEQIEPPSRKDTGTTLRSDTKYSSEIIPLTPLKREPSYLQHRTSNSPLIIDDYPLTPPDRKKVILLQSESTPATRKTQSYLLRPTRNDTSSNYEPKPLKYDDYQPSADHRREYSPKSVTSVRVVQEIREDENSHSKISQSTVFPDKDIHELSSHAFITIPSAHVTQPDTISLKSNRHQSPQNKKHDDRHDTGTTTPAKPVRHGYQQQIRTDSPVLNIGTEKIIRQSATNEFATPFETRYVAEPNRDFHITSTRDDLRARNGGILLLPVLNSSRTYVFEKQSLPLDRIRQSRTNGNFYLATSPALRSLNSSQIDDSEIDTFRRHEVLRSQVA